jgi:putative membrane protein
MGEAPATSERDEASRRHPVEDRVFGDATRRTYLSEERTLLAWWRSSLAAIAVALGVGRLVPAISKAPKAPFLVLGVGYAVVAIVFVAYGTLRQRIVDRALAEGRFEPVDHRIVLAITGILLLLAVATVATLFVGD